MTTIYGKPAVHAITLARQAALSGSIWTVMGLLCATLSIIVYSSGAGLLQLAAVGIGLLGAFSSLFRAKQEKMKFFRAYVGAQAEFRVAKILKKSGLTAVVNGAVVYGGDADHVVFGPVFSVIETKHGRGTVTVTDGGVKVGSKVLPRDPIEQVKKQVRAVDSIIGLTAVPIVCITDMIGKPFHVRGTWVTSAENLPNILKNLPKTLDDASAIRMAEKLHKGA
jgi:hypothetical protein